MRDKSQKNCVGSIVEHFETCQRCEVLAYLPYFNFIQININGRKCRTNADDWYLVYSAGPPLCQGTVE